MLFKRRVGSRHQELPTSRKANGSTLNIVLKSLTHQETQSLGSSIKYITLFWTNFDPSPSVTLCHTSRETP